MSESIEKGFELVSKSKTFKNILDGFDLRNKSVLDIGCSHGEFLTHFGEGSTGVSISYDEVEYGKEKGLDLRYGNIESDSFSLDKKYDVIFANNIFEHLYSPHHFLIKIKKYLNQDGILILGVPCMPKIVSLVNYPKFRGSLASAHINFFTKDTLIKTVERGGWDPVGTRGFHFKNKYIDTLFNIVYPHFYVVSKNDDSFEYPKKRLKELLGYDGVLDTNPR